MEYGSCEEATIMIDNGEMTRCTKDLPRYTFCSGTLKSGRGEMLYGAVK
jgi:hypothetical protein